MSGSPQDRLIKIGDNPGSFLKVSYILWNWRTTMTLNKSYLSRFLLDVNNIREKNILHIKMLALQLWSEQRCIGLVKQHFYFTNEETMCSFAQNEKWDAFFSLFGLLRKAAGGRCRKWLLPVSIAEEKSQVRSKTVSAKGQNWNSTKLLQIFHG